MRRAGFTLPEMLIALAISGVVMLGAAKFLPLLQSNNLRILLSFQLQEELQLIMGTLEKSVRRAGYCHGKCQGEALRITDGIKPCLLVRWDENSNGEWEGPGNDNSDYYGYRLRDGNLETQRGVDECDSGGWEKMNDPASMVISDFRLIRQARQIRLVLGGYARHFPQLPLIVERWITAENL